MSIRIGVLVLCLTGTAFGQAGGPRSADRTTHFFATIASPSTSSTAEAKAQPSTRPEQREFRLLATNKTSTMQKELNEAGAEGFIFVGVTVGDTLIGGKEVVSILRRPALK